MSSLAPVLRISSAVSAGLSASTWAVAMSRPVRCFTAAAMASHFETVREARVISPKSSGTMAHLWATTLPTPPAPMIRTLFIILVGTRGVRNGAGWQGGRKARALKEREASELAGWCFFPTTFGWHGVLFPARLPPDSIHHLFHENPFFIRQITPPERLHPS